MSRRVSRRAFIGGAAGVTALAAAGAAWAALLNRDDDEGLPAVPHTPAAPPPTPTAVPTLAPRAQGSQVIASRGSHNFDTFDAQLSGKSSVLEVLGRTHSRLLNWGGQWDAPAGLRLESDLAFAWEQPDATIYHFTLDPKAKWHGRPPLDGRAVTAGDVVQHFRRSLQLAAQGKAPLAQRYHRYLDIDTVDSPQPGLVRFRTKSPDPYLFDTLAGEFALIQAPEAVEAFAGSWSKLDSDHVVGTGPWAFDWADEGLRFSAFTAGHRQPLLETLRVVEPANAAQRFIEGQLDEAPVFDRRDAERLRSALGRTEGHRFVSAPRFSRDPVMSTFFVGSPPWNNPDLIVAIGSALRRELLTGLFGGRAAAIGVLPLGLAGPAVTERQLVALPGYGESGTAARNRWEAAGGPGLGAITIDFPSIFDPLYSASSTIIDALTATLGPQFRPAVETYTTISKRVLEGYYGNGRAALWLGWGPPLASPDGNRYARETYGAGSPGQLITGGRGARDPSDSAEIARNGFFGIVPWAQQIVETFRTPGASAPEPSPFWPQHLDFQRRNV